MKGKLLSAAVVALFLLTAPEKASANSACFYWDCTAGDNTCDFTNLSDITSGSLWRFAWDFNGTGHLTSNWYVNNWSFTVPYPTVEMTMWLFGANEVSTGPCQIVVWNAVSPPLPLSGYCGDC